MANGNKNQSKPTRSAKSAAAAPTPSPNPQPTPLSYNIVATTTWEGDPAGTMDVVFTFAGQQMGFPLQVSGNGSSSSINADWNYGIAVIYAGATVTLVLNGAIASVTFTGTVGNGAVSTKWNNKLIASYNDIG
jgi:hypothetical protein